MVSVKICGLSTSETIDAAIKGGASHVGLNFFARSPRHLSFEKAAQLAARVPGHVGKVGVFVDPDNALIEQAMAAADLDAIQLHNASPARAVAIGAKVRRDVWIALPVKTRADLTQAGGYRGAAAFILYDAKTPDHADLPGGMGIRFDWTLLQGFTHPLPWGLAGGLTPENVAEAIRITSAPLVDVSSGVETAPGVKDVDKIAAFLQAARHAQHL